MSRPLPISIRISRLDPLLVRWILARANTFVACPRGKKTRERPAWTYRQIATNLRKSKGVKLSRDSVRRLVVQRDPELARARGDCFHLARFTRKKDEEGAA